MCFRPTVAEIAAVCPDCGKKINPVMGNLPLNCPFCDADISALSKKDVPVVSSPSIGAQSVSAMQPKVATAPKPPAAPKAPQK